MAVFTIADPHLSLGGSKAMDIFPGWDGYVALLEANWRAAVAPEDTVVLAGDISWGMSLEESLDDFRFLDRLPGRKLILKGNHDYWWTTKNKMDRFFEHEGLSTLQILHNNAFAVEGLILCGTRGWIFDGEGTMKPDDRKVLAREAGRLRASLEAGRQLEGEPVVFLHYPPVYASQICTEILDLLCAYGIRRCYYGHIHGPACRYAVNGTAFGIEFRLVSGDFLRFQPMKIN